MKGNFVRKKSGIISRLLKSLKMFLIFQ